MSDQFLGEIRIFPLDFPPFGWAVCNGQTLPISQNTALFSILGTTYGGNGVSTFQLPNLQGMVPIHAGQGPGLSLFDLGETLGSDAVTLLTGTMPGHTHVLSMEDPSVQTADTGTPGPGVVLAASTNGAAYRPDASSQPVQMSPSTIAPLGGSQPHNNLQPYLTFTFCIALQGVFPPRS